MAFLKNKILTHYLEGLRAIRFSCLWMRCESEFAPIQEVKMGQENMNF